MGEVGYFEHELMPGKPMFRCERLSCTLQVASCAAMWTEANGDRPSGRNERCQRCALGAKHAGVSDANMSPIRGQSLCIRGHLTDQRMIGGLICVSCYNRQSEVLKGKNAKGKAPLKHPPLERRCVRYVADGRVVALCRQHTVSTDELVLEVLRDSPKKVVFGRGVSGGALAQRGLI